jgi:hypothetical protein
LSNFAVRFDTVTPVSCAKSGASVYVGFCLNSTDLNMIVSEEIYNRDFKVSYPQIKAAITITRKTIRSILSHSGATLPVGFLIGKKIQPLSGETVRYKCSDFILKPLSPMLKYQFATPQDKVKYDKENLSVNILGMFICGAPLSGSKLERDTIATLGAGKICLVIRGIKIGEQKGTLIKFSTATEEIGVFVE